MIESYAQRFGYGVVRDFTGHGIGTAFHSGLVIPHYDDPRYDTLIEPGMTFTIEPMLTLGTPDWDMWDDGWTVVTKDRQRTAQFEHTLLVTDTGAEILTLPEGSPGSSRDQRLVVASQHELGDRGVWQKGRGDDVGARRSQPVLEVAGREQVGRHRDPATGGRQLGDGRLDPWLRRRGVHGCHLPADAIGQKERRLLDVGDRSGIRRAGRGEQDGVVVVQAGIAQPLSEHIDEDGIGTERPRGPHVRTTRIDRSGDVDVDVEARREQQRDNHGRAEAPQHIG